ncbi:hypothetical protein QBC36DRAFT_90859 [Triangularia setosa]|uniref:Pfs domain protein n=1 Tax=Triangularia setosa TaxID=2587417 RepID=A0AAN6VYA2_9PEZI|nr:hypothetical protein QBC36DRAFT_90859 [Podospora setosa]
MGETRLLKKKSSRSASMKAVENSLNVGLCRAKVLTSENPTDKGPRATSKNQDRPSQSPTQRVAPNQATRPHPKTLFEPFKGVGLSQEDGDPTGMGFNTETDYSDEDDAEDFDVDVFKSKFAESLASQVRQIDIDVEKEHARRMFDSLPSLLATFALRLGQKGSTQTHMDAMYLVYKFRQDISNRFKASITGCVENSSVKPLGHRGSNSEPTSSRIRDWLDTGADKSINADAIPKRASRSPEGIEPTSRDSAGTLLDNSKYEAVFGSAAYTWLLSSIAKVLYQSPPSPLDAISVIGSRIRGRYRNHRKLKISRYRPSDSHTMYLLADLDLVTFLNDQYPERSSPKSSSELLSTTITLTGLDVDAQALPCAEYIQQTWPITGLYVMNAICSAPDTQASSTEELPDGSEVTANLIQEPVHRRLGIRIKAKGTVDFLGEVGEIFGWLTAALRASPDKYHLAWCEPYLHYTGKGSDSVSDVWEMRFNITKPRQGISDDKLGQCWQGMFRNPVIVKGFPISDRPCRNTGLEMPLHMAAGLMDTPKLHEFMGRYYLKGFATMLAPVELTGGIVLWHFYHNPLGRISYCDAVNNGSKDYISLERLHSSRHIIGWCSEALCMAGDKDANYNVRNSALPFPGREFSLEKVSLSLGNIITGGCQFNIGKKDIPLHITKQGYIAKLRWIDQKYLIFWDEEDKRGWLVRGSSALLHLVRASLEHCRSDKFSSEFLFDFEAFKESPTRFRSDSSLDVLLNKDNRSLWLYREEKTQEKTIISSGRLTKQTETTATFTTLEDKIVELYESLEKLIDSQAHSAASSKGINAKPRGSGKIEGWDFKDIATTRDPLYLRVASLPDYGRTWTDFAKSIRAVTLFGCGFGDIIKPNLNASNSAAKPTQSDWNSMPAEKGLLGACLADLTDIIESQGKLECLDKLFKSEEVNPGNCPHGGVIIGLQTRLKRRVRAVLPGPSQIIEDSQTSTSTTSYSDDASTALPSLIVNHRSAGGPSEIPDNDPISQDTLATTPGICRTPSRSGLENLAPSIADDQASPDDDGNTSRPAGVGLGSVQRLPKRPRDNADSQDDNGGNNSSKRRRLLDKFVTMRAARDSVTS